MIKLRRWASLWTLFFVAAFMMLECSCPNAYAVSELSEITHEAAPQDCHSHREPSKPKTSGDADCCGKCLVVRQAELGSERVLKSQLGSAKVSKTPFFVEDTGLVLDRAVIIQSAFRSGSPPGFEIFHLGAFSPRAPPAAL